jgi:predicted CxxxxCH...CXXCH cytochrome family protein
MNSKMLLGLLVACWLVLPGSAQATPVHHFDCKDCHTNSVDLMSVGSGNLCLQCHLPNPPQKTFFSGPIRSAKGVFSSNDASNALNSATAVGLTPTEQTSHFWTAKKDNIPAAGALPPSKSLYTSRYGFSTGKVTCTRCHDPHLPIETDPKLLRMTAAGDLICFDCHRPWKLSNNRGRETHPIVADYAAAVAANPTKYLPVVANVGSGAVQLVGGGVSCASCHGVHFSDSHSGTPDGRDNRAGLQPGDGKLLRTDGPKRTGADAAATAQLRSNLCQACHTYKTHGENNPIGCLDCHSGHVYNNGDPNFFVLRSAIGSVYVPKNAAVGPVSNIQFKSASAEWMNAGGTGYCQNCHTLTPPHNGLSSGTSAADSCGECHAHGHASRSFTASCADCHGTPPTAAAAAPAAGGYAKSGSYDYSTSGVYKDESLTPHGSHAGGTDYRFSCDVCHLGKTHASGTFQNVFNAGNIHALASGSGATSPSYNGAGSGTCSAVYCHSNGGARGAAPVAAPGSEWGNGAWAGGKDEISGKLPAARCKSCHGNESASMSARSNSASHLKHLDKGYGCSVCHEGTAASANALAAGAIGTTHVNGSADVSFDNSYELSVGRPLGTGSYAAVAGTCSLYCHSNGQGTLASPDWDLAASGACGTCHSATPTSGSHAAHLNASGANLACDACHGVGAGTGIHAGHVNGALDRLSEAASCNSCHGVEGADTAPIWGNIASAKCDPCHAGSLTTSYTDRSSAVRTASAKSAYASAGHGKAGIAQGCTDCHSTATDAAHMGAGATTRLKAVNGQSYAAATPTAFCGACHDGGSGNETNHYATTGASIDGSKCNICHDPHGVAGYDAMIRATIGGRAVAAFSDRTDRASYAKAGNDGVCQVCHVAADVQHFNQSTYQSSHGGSQVCTDCHAHNAGTAFEVGCSGCHGGGSVGTTSGKKNFWPDASTGHAANTAGAHPVHMQQLIAKAGHASVDAFLNTATSAQQKALCEYCHAAVTNDDDHMATGSAEVFVNTVGTVSTRFAKRIWDGTADGDAAYSAGSCSAVDCHNGKTTPAGFLWYDGGSSACIMCHANVTTDSPHSAHLFASGTYGISIGCGACHDGATNWSTNTKPASSHLNGSFNMGGSVAMTYSGTYPSSKGSCGTNDCHNNGRMAAPATAVYTWGSVTNSGCSFCHLNNAQGHASHFASEGTIVSPGFFNIPCTRCHTSPFSANHINKTITLQAGLNYSSPGSNLQTNAAPAYSTCNTTSCHQDGQGTPAVTPVWNSTAESIGKTSCSLCHAAVPATGSHGDHVRTTPTSYITAAANNTLTEYDFSCAHCHGTTLSNHLNGARNVTQGWTGSQCNASYCHSDGKDGGVTSVASPNWAGGTFSGDKCAGCHKNSPDTNAHHAHEVGFHYKAVYSGLQGFLPVLDSDPVPTGLTYGDKDQIRGHGGRLADGTTSTSTVITCQVCHFDTVKVQANDNNLTCAGCHDGSKTGLQGSMVIADKSKHVDGNRNVKFFDKKVRSKAQVRDELPYAPGTPTAAWTNIAELNLNWTRYNGYKANNGSSYDEQPLPLDQMAAAQGGWNSADKTCQISCHLWEANRVDKIPAKWDGGAILCIDCHTRLPK